MTKTLRRLFFVVAIFLASGFLFAGMTTVRAQDAGTLIDAGEISEPTNLLELEEAEEVGASELEVGEPGRFSWFGNFVRNVRIRVTRDPIKKSELELKKANYEILRFRKIAKEKADDSKIQEKLDKADEKYRKVIEKINARIEKVKEETIEAPKIERLNKFLDKYADHQIKHQEVLKNVALKVPEQARVKIEANRERHLEKFGEVMNKVHDKERFKIILKDAVEEKREIAEERVGDVKEAVIERQENRVERRVNRAEIIEELGEKVKDIAPEIREKVQEIKAERVELFYELKLKREEIRENREEFRQDIKIKFDENRDEMRENLEARQDLKQEIYDDRVEVWQENKEIRQEIGDERQEFRQEARDELKEIQGEEKPIIRRIFNIFKRENLNIFSKPKEEPMIDTTSNTELKSGSSVAPVPKLAPEPIRVKPTPAAGETSPPLGEAGVDTLKPKPVTTTDPDTGTNTAEPAPSTDSTTKNE